MTPYYQQGGRPLLLDLFCGAGGCAVGYHRAGFDVVGIDHVPQPRYPFEFIQADALEYVAEHGWEYDAIHASPPCQGYSRMRHLPWLKGRVYPKLLAETRAALEATGRPWVIENVADAAPEIRGVMLCGSMFGLRVYRHRIFETSFWVWQPEHRKHRHVIGAGALLDSRRAIGQDGYVSVIGKASRELLAAAGRAMDIDWMPGPEISQAVPPAYCEWIGRQLLARV